MTVVTMPDAPHALPAGSRLRCLQCGTQWEHGAWEGVEEGSVLPLSGACPMCGMQLRYCSGAGGFYELSDTKEHYDYSV